MSWADDIRCLYCDGRLPLYRKITNGQFCSGAHRKAYWQEHERLAVERLHQTHDSLRAYRPDGAMEKILGPVSADEIPTQEMPVFVPPASPVESPVESIDSRPQWSPHTHVYTEFAEPNLASFVASPMFRLPKWLPDYLAAIDVYPIESSNLLRWPMAVLTLRDFTLADAAYLRGPVACAGYARELTAQIESIDPKKGTQPLFRFDLDIDRNAGEELQRLVEQQLANEDVPAFAGIVELQRISSREWVNGSTYTILPAEISLRAQLPLNVLRLCASLVRASLLHAGLRQLPVSNAPVKQGAVSQEDLRAIDLRANGEMQLVLSSTSGLAPKLPRLTLAAGSRYRVESQPVAPLAPIAEPETFAAMPPQISLPERSVKVIVARTSASPLADTLASASPKDTLDLHFEPDTMGMMPLACNAQPSGPAIEMRPAPLMMSLPQPLEPKPMRPESHLEPLDSKPTSDVIAASQPIELPPQAGAGRAHVWTHAIDFWNRAPRDLKMLVFALPILLGLALHPSLPKVRTAAPAAANGIERNVQNAFSSRWVNVRQSMVERAAVALDEDFRQGLDDWATRSDATAEWSFDGNGFVRPGSLALYRPSMTLSDYQMQFLGVLDKQALSWVVRAADFDNFYVVKLIVEKPGPLPSLKVLRYAVVDGKADSRVDTMAMLDVRTDSLYRVRVDVQGEDFTLSVQGQIVDSWREPRLKRGGIGFFSARGEESRLRWVQVTHQYDMLGRLCAYLAPYNIPTTSGSWQQ